MSLFKNGSPEHIALGADDKSTRVLYPERDPIAQHTPLAFIFAQKGTTKKAYMSGSKLVPTYGAKTLDRDGPYYNHSTLMLEGLMGAPNSCVVKRLVPADAGPESNIAIFLDVLDADIPNYVRNSQGDYVIDPATNAYKVDTTTPTISGVKLKVIAEYIPEGLNGFGMLSSKQGTMVDANGVSSIMYPILEIKAKEKGEYYNNIGIAIESPSETDVDPAIISDVKALPYKLSLYTRQAAGSAPTVLRSLFGEPAVLFTFKEKAKNPTTGARFDLEQVFNTNWYNETDALKLLRYNDYEGLYLYRNNLELVLGKVMTNEKAYITSAVTTWDDGLEASTLSWFDFTTDDQAELDNELYIINPFTGKSTKNVKYFTLEMDDSTPVLTATQKEVHVSKDTPIFLNGGSDGTLSNENFEALVRAELAKYADPDSEYMDTAVNVESVLYDSGFSLQTKLEMYNFISLRKDTAVAVGTHDAALGEKFLPLSDVRAIAVALKTRAKLAPESSYFGTGVARAITPGGSGLLRNGSYTDRVPMTYEIAIKSAKMMGAGDYKWKRVYAFDHGANAVLQELVDVQPSFIPAGIKPTLWNDGLIWAQPKDRVDYFIPAVQTIYDNDTSVLNSWTTVIALATLNRIADDTWREFTGSNFYTDSEFKEAVLAYLNKRLEGIFAELLVVIPEVLIDDADARRGYSWHVLFKLYAPNMKTKMVSSTEVYRIGALG